MLVSLDWEEKEENPGHFKKQFAAEEVLDANLHVVSRKECVIVLLNLWNV